VLVVKPRHVVDLDGDDGGPIGEPDLHASG
jgi:hypothetical protein